MSDEPLENLDTWIEYFLYKHALIFILVGRDREITTTETGYQIPRLFWRSNNLLFAILHIQLPSDGWIWLLVTEGPRYTKPHTGVCGN